MTRNNAIEMCNVITVALNETNDVELSTEHYFSSFCKAGYLEVSINVLEDYCLYQCALNNFNFMMLYDGVRNDTIDFFLDIVPQIQNKVYNKGA